MLRSEEAVVVPSIEGGMLVDPDMNLCGRQWGGRGSCAVKYQQKIWIERRCQGDEVVPDGIMKGGSVLVTWVTCSEK